MIENEEFAHELVENHTYGMSSEARYDLAIKIRDALEEKTKEYFKLQGTLEEVLKSHTYLYGRVGELEEALKAISRDADRVLYDLSDPQGWREDLANGIDLAKEVLARGT